MTEDETTVILLAVVMVVAVIGVGISLTSLATNESMNQMMGGWGGGRGMMNGTATATSPAGGLEWGVLLVSALFLALAAVLFVRARGSRATAMAPVAPMPVMPASGPATSTPVPESAAAVASPPSPPAAVPEPTLVKLLDADEKRMYLELRDHGGQMYQRDLVALGIFSKAKVTRVLDKLEGKGLIVREAHGMTNRVRLVNLPAR